MQEHWALRFLRKKDRAGFTDNPQSVIPAKAGIQEQRFTGSLLSQG